MLPELHSVLGLLESGFSEIRVLVVGDLMLDRYILGEVERISPEAPVPVLRPSQRYERPGGAANVAMNLAGLGCRACRKRATLWQKSTAASTPTPSQSQIRSPSSRANRSNPAKTP